MNIRPLSNEDWRRDVTSSNSETRMRAWRMLLERSRTEIVLLSGSSTSPIWPLASEVVDVLRRCGLTAQNVFCLTCVGVELRFLAHTTPLSYRDLRDRYAKEGRRSGGPAALIERGDPSGGPAAHRASLT